MLGVWASVNRLLLGVRKVEDGSNETPAIPELLRLLDLMGCIVTIDAIGCQKDIAQAILDRKADYVLAVKDNQGHLLEDIRDWFAYADQSSFKDMAYTEHQTVNL